MPAPPKARIQRGTGTLLEIFALRACQDEVYRLVDEEHLRGPDEVDGGVRADGIGDVVGTVSERGS